MLKKFKISQLSIETITAFSTLLNKFNEKFKKSHQIKYQLILWSPAVPMKLFYVVTTLVSLKEFSVDNFLF
jgi:hypothetical protein